MEQITFELPDVQNSKPEVPIALKKVGVAGIRMPVGFAKFEDKPVILVPTFDLYVDLPANQKGIHASRHYEAIVEVLNKHVAKTSKIEQLCASVAKELLEKHEYATRAEVKAHGDAVFEKKSPSAGIQSYDSCSIAGRALAERQKDGTIKVRKFIGVRVTGITACPCAHEIIKETTIRQLVQTGKFSKTQVRDILKEIPIATHMQRGYGSIIMEIPEPADIDAMQLVRIIENSMSASTYELLKRSEEADLVKRAVGKARFVEDCLRHMIKNAAKAFPDLPDNTVLQFCQRNEESIHKHDIVAKRTIRLGEIRARIWPKA